jgi:hypothetical protein
VESVPAVAEVVVADEAVEAVVAVVPDPAVAERAVRVVAPETLSAPLNKKNKV